MIGTKGVPAQWGGIERYIEEVGKRLAARGHEVTVFGSKWFLKDHSGDMHCGMRIKRVPALHHQATDALTNAFFSTLIIALGDFEVVNFHGYASYFFVPVIKKLGTKTVVTSHGLVDAEWENPKYGGFATAIIRYGGAVGIRNADAVATVADYWKKRIGREYQREAEVVPSGIDKTEPCRPDIITREYGLSKEDFILFLGRIDPVKRIEWVLRLSHVCPGRKIVIAGGAQDASTEAYLRRLKNMSSEASNIIFTGPVAGKVKAELLSNCYIFVNPSRSEGLPVVILEAMSYARCCVASDIPAHREVIENGRTGFLFASGQESALTGIISGLTDTSFSPDAVGAAAKMAAEKKYSWERTVLLTENIYEEVIHGKS
jgi:glycosyltransferase involved in cell wall biosynthesis